MCYVWVVDYADEARLPAFGIGLHMTLTMQGIELSASH